MNLTTNQEKGINVLSLFDGISCARLALFEAKIPVANYYSSEIAKAPLQIQNWNFSSDTTFHQVGDATQIKGSDYAHIKLICAGSPCLQLCSLNPKDRSGLAGPDSSLFYELIRIIKEIRTVKPKNEKLYVLLENVASMQKSEKLKISLALSSALGEEITPIMLDSADCGAPAHRRRLYWSNFPMKKPSFKDVKYQDILVNGYAHFEESKASVLLSNNLTLTNGIFRKYSMRIGNLIFRDKSFADLSIEEKLRQFPDILKASGYEGKSGSAKDPYSFPQDCYRVPSVLESERLMCIKEGFVSQVKNVSKSEMYRCIGLSFTVSVVAGLLEGLKELLPIN